MTNNKQNNRNNFGIKMFMRQLFPAIISCISLAIADMADSIVLGRDVGSSALAAISIVIPMYMYFNVIMHGLGLGGGIRYAKTMAEHKKEEANACYKGIIITAIIIGIITAIVFNIFCQPTLFVLGTKPSDGEVYRMSMIYFRILCTGSPLIFLSYIYNYYLRNDDLEKEAALASSASNIIDVVLNIVLVLILRWGVAGAGIATILGYVISIGISIFAIENKKSNLSFFGDAYSIKPVFSEVFSCYKVGFSNAVWYIGDFFFLIIVNNTLMNSVGYVGVAIFDVVLNMSYFFMYIFRAVSQASQPIISTYEGERNYEGEKEIFIIGIISVLIIGLIGGFLTSVFAIPICQFFGIKETEYFYIGKVALSLYAYGAFFAGISSVLENYFESKEQVKPAFVISSMRGVFILLPVTIVCSLIGGTYFWILFPVTEILTILFFFSIYKGKYFDFKAPDGFDENRICRLLIKNNNQSITEVNSNVEEFLDKWDVSPKQSYLVNMAIEEICVSIINNGFKNGRGYINITVICEPEGDIKLFLRDNAIKFDPFEIKTGTVNMDSSEEELSNIGVFTIKKKAKFFSYRRYLGFNNLCIII